jgi:hypothetical protein
VVPIARERLLEEIEDALLVLDPAGRLVDVNPAARALLKIDDSQIGRPAAVVLPALLAPRPEEGERATETQIPGLPGRVFEMHVSRLRGLAQEPAGRMIIMRDITDRKNAEGEREKLIKELQDALARIRNLSGLLPICSSCKKIRGEDGSWHPLERFVMEHSDAAFSHGLCPDCLARVEGQSGGPPRAPSAREG